MSRVSFRASFLPLAVTALAAACGGDSVLAPPDGTRCTAGSLRVGGTVSGELRADGCQLWSDYESTLRTAESWTLRTAKDKVYIVRLKPIAVNGGDNLLDANVWVYGRNEAGDAVLLTAQDGTYANPDGPGGPAVETVIPSREAMTLSVRVAADADDAVGGYELSVSECPLRSVQLGVPADVITLDASCTMFTYGGLSPSPVAFLSYEGEAGVDYSFAATRSSGTANYRMSVRGPNVDFGCYTDDCQNAIANSGSSPGPITLFSQPSLTAPHTIVIGQASDGTATVSLTVTEAAPPLLAPTTTLQR